MSREELVRIAAIIRKEHLTLKKSINRPRSLENILSKTENLKDLFHRYKSNLQRLNGRLSNYNWNVECDIYENIKLEFKSCMSLLDNSKVLEHSQRKLKFKSIAKTIVFCSRLRKSVQIENKMPKVDIKLGTALVQAYDGAPENLNTFLDAVDLFKDNVDGEFIQATPDQKAAADDTVYKFIKTRLTGTARQAITGAQNLTEIIAKLKTQCSVKSSSDNLMAKLKNLKQKDSIDNFCDQVEQLTLRLATTYIQEAIPADKATQMATKAGVQSLINGVSNSDTKIILRAGTFTSISDATQKIHECNNDTKTNTSHAQVFMTRGNYTQRSRGRGRYTGNRGQYNSLNRTNYNNQRSHSNYRYNQQEFRAPNYRGQGNRGRGRYRPTSFYHPQQQATYFAQSQTPPSMQPAQQPQNLNFQQRPVNQAPMQTESQFHFLGQCVPRTQ